MSAKAELFSAIDKTTPEEIAALDVTSDSSQDDFDGQDIPVATPIPPDVKDSFFDSEGEGEDSAYGEPSQVDPPAMGDFPESIKRLLAPTPTLVKP